MLPYLTSSRAVQYRVWNDATPMGSGLIAEKMVRRATVGTPSKNKYTVLVKPRGYMAWGLRGWVPGSCGMLAHEVSRVL